MSERSHFWIGLRYVEANPCRANMVTSPADYPWSSAAVHLSGAPDRTRILDLDFWEGAGGATTWADLHSKNLSPDQVRDLRKCTYAGRPFGEHSFVEEMEARFQRKWLRKNRAATANSC